MEPLIPPENCVWWHLGDETQNPPQDIEFLQRLTIAGISTFVSRHGLFGAVSNNRMVDVIHRGSGRRWRLGFILDGVECHSALLTQLHLRSDAVIEWLRGAPLNTIEGLREVR